MTTITHRLPSAPSFERIDLSKDDSVSRQCILLGNPFNDEQRSDDLSDPSRRVRRLVQSSESRESTNLSLDEDGEEDTRGGVAGVPRPSIVRPNEQQQAHGIKGGGLDEYGFDGPAQSTNSGWSPRGSANVPAMHNKPGGDHEGE